MKALSLIGSGLWVATLFGCDSRSQDKQALPAAAAPEAVAPQAVAQAAPAGDAVVVEACATICAHTVTLNCGEIEHCAANCAEAFGLTVCQGELRKFMLCTAATPAENFQCGSEGMPSLRPGYCADEQRAVLTCVAPLGNAAPAR